MSMQHQYGCHPVTALAFGDKYLFAGEGTFLNIYDRTTTGLLSRHRIFDETAIHGISLACGDDGPLLIWGGSFVAIIKVIEHSGKKSIHWVVNSTECSDWILDGQFSPLKNDLHSDGPEVAALITAHNALVFLDLKSCKLTRPIEIATSQSRSILYCAKISWESTDSVLMAAGTVFGQIILWSAAVTPTGTTTYLHKIFSGHEGSPFGLCFSEEFCPNPSERPLRLLASCSDDRTVRLWDIGTLEQSHNISPPTLVPESSDVGSTGFVSHAQSSGSVRSGPVAQAMGHLSRIWGVAFLHGRNSSARLVTFGEDATCQYWTLTDLERAPDGSWTGNLINIGPQERHSGKHIWSQAISYNEDGKATIATGGADGSIALQNSPIVSRFVDSHINASEETSTRKAKIRSYSFLTSAELLLVSNTGHVHVASLPSRANMEQTLDVASLPWRDAHYESDLAGFSMTASVTSHSIVFLAGKSGSLFVYNPELGLIKVLEGERKTAGVFARAVPSHADQESFSLCLLTRLGDPLAELVKWHASSSTAITRARLALPNDEIVSTFNVITADQNAIRLAIGFRSGEIAIYEAKVIHGEFCDLPSSALHLQSIHSDAITDIHPLKAASTTYLTVASRSGSTSICQLGAFPLCLNTVHHVPTPLSEVALLIPTPTAEPTLAGFHRKSFQLISASSPFSLCSIPCGGSNRSWEFDPYIDEAGGTLAWTAASRVMIQSAVPQPVTRIHSGGHGREIRAVAIGPRNTIGRQTIATGSEDTDIKLSVLETGLLSTADTHVKMRCLRTLRGHNTGLQDLKWSQDGRYLVSAGGCDEVYVWRVQDLPLELGEIGVTRESRCPFVSEEGDLRVMALEVHGVDSQAPLQIAMVRSDSSIGIYWYEHIGGEGKWQRKWEGNYLAGCLMGILAVPGDTTAFLTMATDGHGAMFHLTGPRDGTEHTTREIQWTKRIKVHQSAVHAAAIVAWSDETRLLFSGGDDNALSVSMLRSDNIISTITVPRAHAAALTALEVISVKVKEGRVRIATSGLDQRMKLWEVIVDTRKAGADGLDVHKLESRHTPVADVGCIASWEEEKVTSVMVCGVGWDVWSFPHDSRSTMDSQWS